MIESTKMKLRPVTIFFVSLGYYLLLSLVPDKKMLIIVFMLASYMFSRWVRNMPKAVFLLYFIHMPIIVGKKWITDLVLPSDLSIFGRPFGISSDVTLTPQHGIIIVMGAMVVYELVYRNRRIPRKDGVFLWLLILPVTMLIATFVGSVYPAASALQVVYFLMPGIVYVFMTIMRPKATFIEVLSIFGAIICFETGLSLLQMLRGSTLGLSIEEFPQYVPLDFSTDAGIYGITRLGGTYGHANNLGHVLSFLVPLFLPFLFLPGFRMGGVFRWVLLTGVFGLILTQSRSAWLGVGVGIMLFFFIIEKVWRKKLALKFKLNWMQRVIAGVVVCWALIMFIPRISNTLYTLNPQGSGETRIQLMKEAISVIEDRWVTGVGLEMDAYYMYTRSRAGYFGGSIAPSVFSYFPEPVHNGLMRLLMQVGVIGVVPYLIVVYLVFRRMITIHVSRKDDASRMVTLALMLGVVSWYINSMLQPLLPELHLLIAVSMIREQT